MNSVKSLPVDACAVDIGECDEGQDDNSKFKNVKDWNIINRKKLQLVLLSILSFLFIFTIVMQERAAHYGRVDLKALRAQVMDKKDETDEDDIWYILFTIQPWEE